MNKSDLKKKLENHYRFYKNKFSSKDPVWNLYEFQTGKDIELAGLITAAYSYGSVDQINFFIDRLFNKTGRNLYEFTINFSKHKDKKYFKSLYYRFNSYIDIAEMFSTLNIALKESGSLKNFFISGYAEDDKNILPALGSFTERLNKNIHKAKNSYYHYLFSNPQNKSTCKRMNLFLRWMVRKDEIDTGLWSEIGTSKLIMPVDTHIARISKKLGLINRRTVDLNFALELTDNLKKFDHNDPVKYDFALCHIGIDKKDF
ncbi:MAG: TIGR02757 family protein [Ignavibacteria bacterium]|nr:TIGR02757 family protein [Ignavibacteria bacterium]